MEPPEEEPLPKLPFRRLKYALEQVVNVGIPLHVQQLNIHSDSIERLKGKEHPLELRSEQLKAANTFKLIRQDLVELENLNRQVREEDEDLFQKTVRNSLREAVEALSAFMSVHSDVLGPLLDLDEEGMSNGPVAFPSVVCDINRPQEEEEGKQVVQLQVTRDENCRKTADAWTFLKRELLEIHALIHHFSSLVFKQQDSIDTISNNILETRENVTTGTTHLRKAAMLAGAGIPVAGAVLGGLCLGPVGAIFGGKLLGVCVAGGGTVIGYLGGRKLKMRREVMLQSIEMAEMSRAKSESDLTTVCEDGKS